MAKTKKSKPATQDDVQAVKNDVQAVKTDLAAFERRTNTRFDRIVKIIVKEVTKSVMAQMEILLENRAADLLGVSGEEVKLMQDKQNEHEERLTQVEQKIGLRS